MCDKEFKQLANLYSHEINIHSYDNNHKCERCGKYFKTKAHLISHLSYSHVKSEQRKQENKCKDCGKLFLKSDYLQSHILRAHKE